MTRAQGKHRENTGNLVLIRTWQPCLCISYPCYFLQALLSEFHRFHMEEVPPRLRDKQRLAHLYEELQVRHMLLLLLSRTVTSYSDK